LVDVSKNLFNNHNESKSLAKCASEFRATLLQIHQQTIKPESNVDGCFTATRKPSLE